MTAIARILYTLYSRKSGRLRPLIRRLVTRVEGGQVYSVTLRKIFRDYHHIDIGLYSYGGCFDVHNIREFTTIGRYCSFASGVCIFNANHPMTFKSTHPFFFNPCFGYVSDERIVRNGVSIGNDVWFGQNALIMPKVQKIGEIIMERV